MKMLVISSSGDSLPLCLQLQEEGMDIFVYVHNPSFRGNYEGMIKQRVSTVSDLKAFIKDADPDDTTIMFDMTRGYREDCPEDVEFLSVRGLTPETARSENLFGLTAEYLYKEKGFRVIGNCAWGENAEMDRKRGKTIAGQVGLDVPYHIVAQTLSGAIKTMETRFKEVRSVLKPFGNHHLDCTYVEKYPGELLEKLTSPWADRLQWPAVIEQYIPGITIDEEVWFNGRDFVWETLNSTLERKHFGAGETGPHIGSALNLVWMRPRPVVNWRKLQPALQQSGYVGPINATMQICQRTGTPYFLEWACRMGYDAIFGLTRLLRCSLGDFISRDFKVGFNDETVAATIRVSIPPYPYEDEPLRALHAEGTPVTVADGASLRDVRLMDVRQGSTRLECAGADGIVCVAVGAGDTAKDAFTSAERWVSRMRIASDVQYRDDWDCVVSDYNSKLVRQWRKLQ